MKTTTGSKVATGIVVGMFILGAAAACSDDASGGGFSCPAVGDKNCPNDPAATKVDVDFCEKCKAELVAQATCLGENKPACKADGTSADLPADKCVAEQDKVVACYTGGSAAGSDAGSD